VKNAAGKKIDVYVKNEDMFNSILEYRRQREEDPDTRIPEYLGACFIKIASRLATKGNFHGYTYKDEMIADGILDCVKAVNNFDPEKTQNPFGYFTQIIYYAFIRRIKEEKKKHNTVLSYIHELDPENYGEDEQAKSIIESLKRDVEDYQGAQ
jgi:DNA-directed RNA polymerase specialized sigma subunit